MSFRDGSGYGGSGFGSGGRNGGRYGDDQTDISSEEFRKLFVGGLSCETDEKSLRSHFEQWGEIVNCVLMRYPTTKRSRCCGFITYKESFMVDEAQKNRPHTIDNREVVTKRVMPRNADGTRSNQSVKKMFVGDLKDDTTEEQMRDVFGQFGEIVYIKMFTDKATGKCREFAFIAYKDYDSVDKAVLLKRHDLNTRRVRVEKSVPKDQRDGSGRGGGSAGWGQGQGVDSFGFGSGGYSSNGAFGCGYGDGSFGSNGGGYGGVYAGGQNWGGSDGYGHYNSSWGGGSGPGGFGFNYGGAYGSGPVNGSTNMLLMARDFMTMAKDKLTVAAAALGVLSSDDMTEAAVYPEHMDIQEVSQRKGSQTRKRKLEML